MDNRYSKAEMKYLLDLRDEILNSKKLNQEKSLILFKWIKELYRSNIPNEYWRNNFSKMDIEDLFVKKAVREFIENLDNARKEGLGLLFLGPTGVGKTAMMAEIGKAGIYHGLSAIYTTLEKYIASINGREKNEDLKILYDRVWNADMIILDEIDKAYKKSGSEWVLLQFTDLIKGTTPYNKIFLAGMNLEEEELRSKYGEAVYSALIRHLKPTPVTGQDYSENLQKNWMDRLKGKSDWIYNKEIVNQALCYAESIKELKIKNYDEVWDD